MAKIIKRIGKWVHWTRAQRKWTLGSSSQPTLEVTTFSTPKGASSSTPSLAQSPLPPTGRFDQPSEKNITLDKTYEDGFVLMIKVEFEAKNKKAEDPKDS